APSASTPSPRARSDGLSCGTTRWIGSGVRLVGRACPQDLEPKIVRIGSHASVLPPSLTSLLYCIQTELSISNRCGIGVALFLLQHKGAATYGHPRNSLA